MRAWVDFNEYRPERAAARRQEFSALFDAYTEGRAEPLLVRAGALVQGA